VDGSDLGFRYRIGLAAKDDAIRSKGYARNAGVSPQAIQAAPMPFNDFR
jgi:hypothetical protein